MKNKVRELRRNLNLTQEQLANIIGVSRQTIVSIEKCAKEPSGSLVIKISDFFKKDPREIFFTDNVNYVQQK